MTTPFNFYLEVAKGNVPGHSAINKFGHNPAVTTATLNGADVWGGGGRYGFYPTAAQTMEAVSSSTADDSTGTGGRTMQIYGLDGSYNEINETITLDGTTPVTLAKTYIRMYRAKILTAGTNETNEGNISIRIPAGGAGSSSSSSSTDGSAGTLGAYINAGDGQTQQAIYTIPNNKSGYIVQYYVGTADDDKNAEVAEFRWKARENNGTTGAWQTKGQISLVTIGGNSWRYNLAIPGMLPGKTDIRIECFNVTATLGVVGGFDIILVDDGY